ncbi:MAG: ribbon-helix-helix domain-containing protein [Smithellaceae bacterium]
MGKAKIAITLDAEFIGELDRLVEENYFQNRSQAIRDAVREKLARMKRSRCTDQRRSVSKQLFDMYV